jgi:hypothetical protein
MTRLAKDEVRRIAVYIAKLAVRRSWLRLHLKTISSAASRA